MDVTRTNLSAVNPKLLATMTAVPLSASVGDHDYFTILAGRSGRAVWPTAKRSTETGQLGAARIMSGKVRRPLFKFVLQLRTRFIIFLVVTFPFQELSRKAVTWLYQDLDGGSLSDSSRCDDERMALERRPKSLDGIHTLTFCLALNSRV
ncbi:hypothetical protein MMC22_005865 [Lobaria immixta]|nr:hypothetical protein [Lobaria immixta]